MSYKYKFINQADLPSFAQAHAQKMQDWYNNQFHLSGYAGLVNDPNGLFYLNGIYYIFMQNCPFSIHHHNKSWALYTTVDFVNYQYEGITITPSCEYDKHGIFSGSARVNQQGEVEFFYTGNVKLNDKTRTSFTMKATIDFVNKQVHKTKLFATDLTRYSGHFRDPVVFEYGNDLYMLNGAQTTDLQAILSVYQLKNNIWRFKKDVKFDQGCEKLAYMLECPNYFTIDHSTFLFGCLELNGALANQSHVVEYRQVTITNDLTIKFTSNLKRIDEGFDFYAPQVFNNTINETIMLGWLGNSQSHPLPPELTTWSNQLTIPRRLFMHDNQLYQLPVNQLKKLRTHLLFDQYYENGLVELLANNINDQSFMIRLSSTTDRFIEIKYENGHLIIDRSHVDFTDEVNLPSLIKVPIVKMDSLQMLVDRSALEIFVNNGEKAIAVRFYLMHHHQLTTTLQQFNIYQLIGYNYQWNNIIYQNRLEHQA